MHFLFNILLQRLQFGETWQQVFVILYKGYFIDRSKVREYCI